ncbi:hypothetical protein D6Z43_16665 [Pseudomonas sp. DY-1]|nr:hypothetical protein D6Z43_16665 [Pseudomonas sp. DY-1]MDH4651580.1 hypothetical protein [Pseudomonas sp. BN606]MRK20634.1 hypothetical protein [Pseudomonas sp. JG-B]
MCGACAAKSPVGVAVIGLVGAIADHGAILYVGCWPCGPENKNPRSGCRPGVSWSFGGDPAGVGRLIGYQVSPWLNQYP